MPAEPVIGFRHPETTWINPSLSVNTAYFFNRRHRLIGFGKYTYFLHPHVDLPVYEFLGVISAIVDFNSDDNYKK